MLRVLVAEDSTTTRELLVAILRSDAEITIAGEAKDGAEAVAMTKALRPDVVTMDVRMPLVDGFEATRHIMMETPTPIVIVSAAYDERDVDISMRALRAGALAVLGKPPGPDASDFATRQQQLVATVKAMAGVKVVRRWPDRSVRRLPPVAATRPHPRLVAIAASTGGPAALARVLGDLSHFELPIVVVQHIAAGFVDGFATWLNSISSLAVKVAADRETLRAHTVYVAPDDSHLQVTHSGSIRLSRTAAVGGFRPSATVLFESAARAFGDAAVAVILTGMGDDGVVGLHAIRKAGGTIVAQDEETSVVFGMPGAAVAAGLTDVTIPLDAIGPYLMDLLPR